MPIDVFHNYKKTETDRNSLQLSVGCPICKGMNDTYPQCLKICIPY